MRGRRRLLMVSALAAGALTSCQGPASTLDPAGPRAARDADLWWLMFWLSLVVLVAVLAILAYAVMRSERGRQLRERSVLSDNLLIVGGGIVVPLVVLPVLWIATLGAMDTLAAPPSPPEMTIEVIGHQWWYEVRYPQQGLTLKNELRMPAGRTVLLRVTSADVIHSFWVPRLLGKFDMMPGTVQERWLVAEEPGTYLVECAEFCGLWHARMQMSILAQPPDEFSAWLASQR